MPVDMVESAVDLATLKQYRAVVAPTLIMVKPGVAQTLTQYVREGGTLITGYMSGIPVDLATLKQYRAVVAPTLIMVKPGVAQTLTQYVREGGTLITGYMSGIHNEFDLVVEGGYPGPLRELCGVWVEEIAA